MPEGVGYDTLEPDKQPSAVNSPKGGTYGEGAELERLQQSLPGAGPGGAQPGAGPGPGPPPVAPRPQGPAGGTSGPPGVPAAILGPSDRATPVATPLQTPPMNPLEGIADERQQRMALYDQLANHPGVSPSTREFFAEIRDQLAGG